MPRQNGGLPAPARVLNRPEPLRDGAPAGLVVNVLGDALRDIRRAGAVHSGPPQFVLSLGSKFSGLLFGHDFTSEGERRAARCSGDRFARSARIASTGSEGGAAGGALRFAGRFSIGSSSPMKV